MKSARVLATTVAGLALSVGIVSAQSATEMTGRHTMEGKVTSVSAKTGWVHVKTPEGTIIVHLPPAELDGVKKGDNVSVSLGLKDNGPAKPKAASSK